MVLTNVEEYNLALKSKVKDFEASAKNDCEKFEEITTKLKIAFKKSKSNSEDLEKEIGDFREEILKIKREKKVNAAWMANYSIKRDPGTCLS